MLLSLRLDSPPKFGENFIKIMMHYYLILTIFIGLTITRMSVANTLEQHLVPMHAIWKYQPKVNFPSENWNHLEFDDTNWREGTAGFGYGDDDDRTVLNSMRGKFSSVKIRHRFFVAEPTQLDTLFLYLRYDDGFIAYLNGIEVARAYIEQHNMQTIVLDHEATEFEQFRIPTDKGLLRQGWNVLAIEGFNRKLNSSDFSLDPILTNYQTNNPNIPDTISHDEFLADLLALEQRFHAQASYFRLQDVDTIEKAFATLRASKKITINTRKFALQLDKIIALLGDAHAEVKTEFDDSNQRYLPFALADTQKGLIALKADSADFVDSNHPFIVALDDKPIALWIDAASDYVAQASTQLIRHRALQELRAIDQIRRDLNFAPSDSIQLTLQSHHGKNKIKLHLPLSDKPLPDAKITMGESRYLNKNIGYLRIAKMQDSYINDLVSAMNDFKTTNGLIIDVRDNTGGYYGVLAALYGFFIPEKALPYVANIAAYRLNPRFAIDHLQHRPTYRFEHPGWTNQERQVISRALKKFQPEWKLPARQFSPWHFMLLGRTKSYEQYYYSKPVVVLCNAASFSATDGFLSAFSDLPQAILMGQNSSGGSGARQHFNLPNSGIKIALSSMASFRPNGKLYDGNGIAVDIKIAPTASDFFGKTDTVLDKAIEWLSNSKNR